MVTPVVRRAGITVLAALVVIYLAVITYASMDQLASPMRAVMLIVLWVLGLVALTLLARAFRVRGDQVSR
jgi:hypothetical protein